MLRKVTNYLPRHLIRLTNKTNVKDIFFFNLCNICQSQKSPIPSRCRKTNPDMHYFALSLLYCNAGWGDNSL